MNKRFTNLNYVGTWLRSGVLTLFALCAMGLSNANASCVCSAESTLTLDPETCSKTLTSHDLAGCYSEYIEAHLVHASEHWKGDTDVWLPKDYSITVTVPGRYRYTITDYEGNVLCWNYFIAEDKSGPVCDNDYDGNNECYYVDNSTNCNHHHISGDDDALNHKTLVVSCTDEDHESQFAVLEANDFKDCTGIKDVWYEDTVVEGCGTSWYDADLPYGLYMQDFDYPSIPEYWEICEVHVRAWYASDWAGNVSPADAYCTQIQVVVRPTYHEIHFDMAPPALECDGTDIAGRNTGDIGAPYFYDLDAWGNAYPSNSTPVAKVPLVPGEHTCKWGSTFTPIDVVYTCTDADKGCADNKTTGKLVRQWTWFDWCDPSHKETMTQIIEIEDNDPPEFDIQVSTWPGNTLGCEVDVRVDADAADACSSASYEFFVEVSTDGHSGGSFKRYGPFTTSPITIQDVPLGASVHAYGVAWDCCGNETPDSDWGGPFEDTQAPNCVANDDLVVALVKADYHEGETVVHAVGARVTAKAVNEGSTDNCHPLTYELRWVEADGSVIKPFAPYIDFIYTSDDGFSDKCQKVEWVDLKVCEDKNYNGLCDEDELYSICATQLTFIDSNEPEFSYVDCDSYKCTDHSQGFATPTIDWDPTGCTDMMIGDPTETTYHCPVYVTCGDYGLWVTKRIRRNVTFMKMTEHVTFTRTITQTIYEEVVEDSEIWLPEDIKVVCGSTPTDVPGPVISNIGCSEWLVSEPEISDFTTDGDGSNECGTYIYEYELINWCRLLAWENEHGQIDRNGPEQHLPRTGDTNNDGKILSPEDAGHHYARFMNNTGNSESHPALTDGYARYIQIVKVIDDVDPFAGIAPTSGCGDPITGLPTEDVGCLDGWVSFTVTPDDLCTEGTITDWYINADDNNQHGFSRSGDVISASGLAKGTYTLHVRIDDECGNFVWESSSMTVTWDDCKAPSLLCLQGFQPLMENGSATVWAYELVASISDNCTLEADLLSRLHIEALTNVNGDNTIDGDDVPAYPSNPSASVVLNCNSTGVIAIYTKDDEGNVQFCVTGVALQDGNGDPCPAGIGDVASIIVDDITNENDEMVDEVNVKVSGNSINPLSQMFSGVLLNFSIPMQTTDVSVKPEKDLGYLNGVNTGDLVALQRDILGIKPLTSAYRIIAADVTKDNQVNTKDMLHISRLVLGIYDEFPNVDSWRFVTKTHTFANPLTPWGFPEAVNFATLDNDAQAGFIGIKMGDLTGNAIPTNLLGSDNATNGTLEIAIDDARIPAGATHTIEFTAKDFNQFAGYQFSINLDSRVTFEGVEVGVLPNHSDANFGLHLLSEGIITTNWANANSVELEDGAVLFTLTVNASQDVNVSEILSITSTVTTAEAYDNNLETYGVEALFNRSDASFELFQNTPNPFSNETIIGFNLPTAGKAMLKVMDVSGRILKQIESTYNKGFNQISLNKSDLGATGVLYYQLDTDSNSATKKMIILN